MVIAYVGAFQASIRPDAFLQALKTVRDDDPDFARDVRVRFVGASDPESATAVDRLGLGDVVERTGFISHDQAVREMVSADVLLQVLGMDPGLRHAIGSKLPEYLASGSAYLLLGPADGEAAEIVTRAHAGIVVPPDDVDAVAAALRTLYAQWRAGTLPTPDPAVVAEFDRTRLFAEVDGILRGLASGAGDGAAHTAG
jgi:glycosyltransferase involved in cell wall biosynthesis